VPSRNDVLAVRDHLLDVEGEGQETP